MKPLNNWKVDDEDGEFVVYHYIGGEDYTHTDDWYPTQEEAQARADSLNSASLSIKWEMAEGHATYQILGDYPQ